MHEKGVAEEGGHFRGAIGGGLREVGAAVHRRRVGDQELRVQVGEGAEVDAAALQRPHQAPGQVVGPKQQPHLHASAGRGQQVIEHRRRRRRDEGHGGERLEARAVEHPRHQAVDVPVEDVAETGSTWRRRAESLHACVHVGEAAAQGGGDPPLVVGQQSGPEPVGRPRDALHPGWGSLLRWGRRRRFVVFHLGGRSVARCSLATTSPSASPAASAALTVLGPLVFECDVGFLTLLPSI